MYRCATIRDIPTLVLLKLKMFVEIGMDHLLRNDFTQVVTQTYLDLYASDMAKHFVIETNGEIIACAGAFIKEDIPYCFYKEERYGFIGDVYVLPIHRRKGYARTLTEAVITYLTKQDIKTIRLLASKEAHSLYESLGFKGTEEMVLHR